MAQGLRIRRSDGTVQLSTEDGITTFRHLSSHLFDEYQPETAVPAPGFDEAKGVLQIVHHADRTLDEFADGFVAPNVFDVPTITHADGVLTYAPPATTNNQYGPDQQITVNLYHYS